MVRSSLHIIISAISFLTFILITSGTLHAQSVTKVSGKVLDDKTGEPMAFVNVIFKGTSVGASTDLDGNFNIESRFVSDSLCANFLGFEESCTYITQGIATKKIELRLSQKELLLKNVVVIAKKGKYSKKNTRGKPNIKDTHKQICRRE